MVKSRDFVNLRCWHLFRNGQIVSEDEYEISPVFDFNKKSHSLDVIEENSNNERQDSGLEDNAYGTMHKSFSEAKIDESKQQKSLDISTLSKSLGAKGFFEDGPPSLDDDQFADAEDNEKPSTSKQLTSSNNIYVSAAISIPYLHTPSSSKYIRFVNFVYCNSFLQIIFQL